jgi:hypothetical protein
MTARPSYLGPGPPGPGPGPPFDPSPGAPGVPRGFWQAPKVSKLGQLGPEVGPTATLCSCIAT